MDKQLDKHILQLNQLQQDEHPENKPLGKP